MTRLTRVYVFTSCVFSGALLASGLLAAVAAWIAPEWLEEVGRGISERLAGISSARADAGGRGGLDGREAPALDPTARGAPAHALGGLDAARPEPASFAPGIPASVRLRLEAWESIRAPLLDLLRAPLPGETAPAAFEDRAEIAAIAPRVGARLAEIRAAAAGKAARLTDGMEPRTLARLLLDERALSDAGAAECLSRMDGADASEVLDVLSRLSPERAARLIEQSELGKRGERGEPGERGELGELGEKRRTRGKAGRARRDGTE